VNSAARRHAQVALCEIAMDANNVRAVAEQPGAIGRFEAWGVGCGSV